MKKIPTIFDRDWAGNRNVVDKQNPECAWVFAGAGIATQKIDGTSCMVRDGAIYKRRELRDGDTAPAGFELSDTDEGTHKRVGWVPVGDGPEDKWHRVAFEKHPLADGTCELVGPKVQGNPEHFAEHTLISHNDTVVYEDCPRTFENLKEWLSGKDIEGIVFHHPDGRMAKIKLRDFGLRRNSLAPRANPE